MTGPRRSHEHSLLQVAAELWEAESLEQFRAALLTRLHALIGADIASYNEIAGDSQEAFVVADPAETLALTEVAGQLERFGELVQQNPLAAHSMRTGDTRARRMSDFIGRRQLHALELYDCIYRPLGVESQVAFSVPSEGQLVGVTLSRSASDFDEDELALLDAVAKIAIPIHRALHERVRAQAVLRAVEAENGAAQAIVLVQASGALEPAHARAERLLVQIEHDRQTAESLRAWVCAQRRFQPGRVSPLRLTLGAGELEARYVRGESGSLDAVCIRMLAEPAAGTLRALGLTSRQAEVLQLVWKGAANAEIALSLRISEHTVRHHLEHIYRRLGVDSRGGAAHAASRAALEQNC
jgi:DNA-binding CsgD family transcriptional regulator